MPKKKTELIAKYKEWHVWPGVSTFDILDDDVMLLLDSDNDEDDTNNAGIEMIEIDKAAM